MSEPSGVLQLQPIGVRRPWGGRRLLDSFRSHLDTNPPLGETWEVSDVGDQDDSFHSVVVNGSHAGRTLRNLLEEAPEKILGKAHCRSEPPRLPLLYKFIDAAQDLSVQVHPDDVLARQLGLGNWGKSEAWIILDALPGSSLQVGLKKGWDVAQLVDRVKSGGDVGDALNRIPVQRGDLIELPAGTIHSIGAGILLAEIQQSSDVTWRVYDGDRIGLDGRKRELHLDQVLLTTPPDSGPPIPLPVPEAGSGWNCRIDHGPFLLHELHGEFLGELPVDPGSFSIMSVLEGRVRWKGSQEWLQEGDVRFILPMQRPLELECSPRSWVLCASPGDGLR